ncbi:class I SAM-dependent methyltransferase [Candidatus Bathyarchaeota archaeon]|nr:class I SAM-dependent methyltransferase [Candidatus Bathyarchaeota archaeon]
MKHPRISLSAKDECWRKKRRVIRYYNRLARIYNLLYGQEQKLKIIESLKAINLNENDMVLDAGCGTGLLFSHINGLVKTIIGIDTSPGILKAAMKLVKNMGGKSTITLLRADADFLPFKEGIFDKVFAITLLQNMPNPALTLSEIARVTKANSEIIVTGLKKFFLKEDFLRVLSEAGMNPSIIDAGDGVKCYIAICNNGPSSLSKDINIGMHSQLMVKANANAW